MDDWMLEFPDKFGGFLVSWEHFTDEFDLLCNWLEQMDADERADYFARLDDEFPDSVDEFKAFGKVLQRYLKLRRDLQTSQAAS